LKHNPHPIFHTYISYNANAKTKAVPKARDALTKLAEAPLFAVELGVEVEDVPEVFDEEVFEAVPFVWEAEAEVDDTELVKVVPVGAEPVEEVVAEGVD